MLLAAKRKVKNLGKFYDLGDGHIKVIWEEIRLFKSKIRL